MEDKPAIDYAKRDSREEFARFRAQRGRITPTRITVVIFIAIVLGWFGYREVKYRQLLTEYYANAPSGLADLERSYEDAVNLSIREASLGLPRGPDVTTSYLQRISRAKQIRVEINQMGRSAPND